jgi:hypothetical protein
MATQMRRRLTALTAAHIKWLARNTDLLQDQIGARVNQNQGRVSEVLSGQRFADVEPRMPEGGRL